jgi:hypothetical protein
VDDDDDEKVLKILLLKPEGKKQLARPRLEGRIILKWTLMK